VIDYIENARKRGKIFQSFFNLLKRYKDIDLVTSDYVLWEFYGYFKKELYAKKLLKDHRYTLISSHKECYKEEFGNAKFCDIEKFGEDIDTYRKTLEEFLTIISIFNTKNDQFNELIDKLFKNSKFSFKDIIVFSSAVHTQSDILITSDRHFSNENHLERLKKAITSLPPSFRNITFKKVDNFSGHDKIRAEYKNWFCRHNEKKAIGKVVNYFKKLKVIHINCNNNKSISVKDRLYLIKFDSKNKMLKLCLPKLTNSNFKDFNTKKYVKTGNNITIKTSKSSNKIDWRNALVYLSE
jgi:hypothetical protein